MGKINIVKYPPRETWERVTKRPGGGASDLDRVCETIFEEVRREGDEALRRYTRHFDRARPEFLEVTGEEFEEAARETPAALREAILLARARVERFHVLQAPREDVTIHDHGIRCWQETRPIERVGLYVPGGSAPLFSTVVMLVVPARLAGCREIALCTPPRPDGKVHPAIAWSARACGATRLYKVGGVQAIAAMTFGTESIRRVDKILGPGNAFVTAAKQRASTLGVAIDMPAGPSELMVVADETADPRFVAADLLSQAEHGPDSQVFLVTSEEYLPERVEAELERQARALPRGEIIERALGTSTCVVLRDREECADFINSYAPEHLMLSVKDSAWWIPLVQHAGSVFIGNYSP
ncbi:MAG: histidinol dehydrogenase, partial [Odoribacteraceae bacterium]|nr:histidinol dehydrogenase [Odoribacteraceae bacterium]